MSSAPDRSRFVDGFQRNLVSVPFPSGTSLPLERGDTLCAFPLPFGVMLGTLPAPDFPGQQVTFQVVASLGGSAVVTSTVPVNAAGQTSMTFTAVGSSITLLGLTDRWQVLQNDGVTLA